MSTRTSDLEDRERQRRALDLKREGYTWAEVADMVGYASKQSAQRGVERLLDRIEAEDVDLYRAVEGARLDAAWREQWAHLAAMNKSGTPAAVTASAAAVSSLVRISERRSKLLGLDAPTKVDVGSSSIDLDGTVAAIMSALDGESDSGDGPGDSGAAGDTDSDQ
ncbi:hypothetical protein [Rhodococcus ruber]|uniref:hypothetical protein n=1 Tax=Rhodococcus ruber TaxID=1830 RepID=UPI001F427331|nr:hypothetical protein [Rhodococcus ruber]MCF8786881.1 hypothetical protein [Rhodococcus ruber]